MATVRTVVNTALRKLGRLGASREPRTADAADTLAALQGMYLSWIASGAFGRLNDVVPIGTNYTAFGNERILRNSADTMTVTLPELVPDGFGVDYGRESTRARYYGTIITITQDGDTVTVDVAASQPVGYSTTPRDGAPVVITDTQGGQTLSWLYDGTVKSWQQIEGLTLDSEAPRSHADYMGLSALLAIEVADQFGVQPSPLLAGQAARFTMQMVSRFGMRREATQGIYC